MTLYIDQVKKVTAEKERIGAELDMASRIQGSQLPRLFPPFPDRKEFSLYASMTPAKEVGGDFYDFFMIDDDHMGFVMADVSGKGVPAALLMMVSRVLIKSTMQSGKGPAETLKSVNNQLCEGNDADFFVTVWLAVLEISTGKGVAANAGHEHPALRRADGSYDLIVYKHSMPVGVMRDLPFREHEFQLNPGDSFFVYTDGVVEATNADKKLYGSDRMLQALNRNPDAQPEQMLANISQDIDRFVDGAKQFDDITMLCFRYFGPSEES
jgi:sigma-B regulation protein RsbU (phosphoserine phosphatase)